MHIIQKYIHHSPCWTHLPCLSPGSFMFFKLQSDNCALRRSTYVLSCYSLLPTSLWLFGNHSKRVDGVKFDSSFFSLKLDIRLRAVTYALSKSLQGVTHIYIPISTAKYCTSLISYDAASIMCHDIWYAREQPLFAFRTKIVTSLPWWVWLQLTMLFISSQHHLLLTICVCNFLNVDSKNCKWWSMNRSMID